MIDKIKRNQVYEILLLPIECTKYSGFDSERKEEIIKANNKIKSTQTYWPEYKDKNSGKPFRYDYIPDCDVSDFACGFYEIIYEDILNGENIIDKDGNFTKKIFAGDTMNTGIISKYKKTKLAPDKKYCLANFWILPMWIGRDSGDYNPHPEHSKTRNNCNDYIKLYLKYVENKWNVLQEDKFVGEYFKKFNGISSFMDKHFISYNVKSETIQEQHKFIQKRARLISESKYCDKLWNYFKSLGLIVEFKEEYLEADEYPFDENYSIPDMCDECSTSN